MSMAPSSIQMVLVEGENADGATVEEDEIGVVAADDPATSASGHAIAAILGTREGANDAGLRLTSIGVAWTDQLEAHALRDALAAHKVKNVMLVSAFLAAAALTQSVGAATGYERTAVLFVEPDSATLAVVETADGSISDIRASSRTALADLVNMVVGLERLGSAVGGVFVIGSGVDVAPLKPHLEAATSLAVNVPEEPGTALARGAALASANAPLFASSTAALAYSLDPGTGAVNPSVLPDYLKVPDVPMGDELAYSAVPDDDADTPTVVIKPVASPGGRRSHRKPVLLLGSSVAVVAIAAVVALEIATAVNIRKDVVALQPAPDQNLIVPTQQAPAPTPAEVPAAQPKVEMPAQAPAPKPLNPVVAPAAPAPAPAAPAPAVPAPAAPVPAAPIPAPAAPAPAPPVVPVPVVVPVPIPPLLAPRPEPAARPPVVQLPPLQSPPRPAIPPRGEVPGSPPQIGGPVPQQPVRQSPPG
ncbi:hypothetical protein A9W99_12225, partial [Mycobacterium sp. 1164966.3]|uniref:DUF7159 family protein n=1 Tax=Mycobacterium sp. 1164966.3 TaxID=1856861 RepID=UPI0007FF3542